MLNKISLTLVAVLALLFGVSSASQAQNCANKSCTANITASVNVLSGIVCLPTQQAINFGDHFKEDAVISGGGAEVKCTLSPSVGVLNVHVALPSAMIGPNGSTPLPMAFTANGLQLYDASFADPMLFEGLNPADDHQKNITSGFMTLTLDGVSVNLGGATATGQYTAPIVVTIALQ